jgi:uncharacterized protein YuzE
MNVSYDAKADAIYIQLADEILLGGVKKTYPCDPLEVGGEINLDFDAAGRLIGIEVLDASKKLPQSVLRIAREQTSRGRGEA